MHMQITMAKAMALPADLSLRASEGCPWAPFSQESGGGLEFSTCSEKCNLSCPRDLGCGIHRLTHGTLTSATVRAQEAQEAVAGPRDAVAVAIAVAGTVIHRFWRRKEKKC